MHSDNKRQRQFRWKGLDDSLEVGRRDSDGEDEAGEDGGDAETWRLQRLEREKWVKGTVLTSVQSHCCHSQSQTYLN